MAAPTFSTAPVLSTPAEHMFEHVEPPVRRDETGRRRKRSAAELREVYEIQRTAMEICDGGWARVALQFPDAMLPDATGVLEILRDELASRGGSEVGGDGTEGGDAKTVAAPEKEQIRGEKPKIYILADTSYSACCVDEVAAEHIDAQVVVHYGRSCLSPTSRLPVIYVFTKHVLGYDAVRQGFEAEFPEKAASVMLMADVTYQDHVPRLAQILRDAGYSALLETELVRDPAAQVPNRKISQQPDVVKEGDKGHELKKYDVFHISTPPTALLLTLSSRVKSLRIYPTETDPSSQPPQAPRLLGRRYARVLTLSTAAVIGILVNTLSVSNYLSSVSCIKAQIAAAGKKSYTMVVGKLNAAKLANFAEVDGWVVVGCWESSLVEEDAGFYRPLVTPFELELALKPDEERIWTGEWWGGTEEVKGVTSVVVDGVAGPTGQPAPSVALPDSSRDLQLDQGEDLDPGDLEGEESEPPQFDLRTGKLVTNSRPMRVGRGAPSRSRTEQDQSKPRTDQSQTALALRPKAELAAVNGVVSPGAEYLRSQRTWTGLGSDFGLDETSASIEEGRSGVARGYTSAGEQSRT
jgi:diphthamide biosynthesis protein 2